LIVPVKAVLLGKKADLAMVLFVQLLERFLVACVAEVRPAAERTSFALGALALFPEGAEGAVGREGFWMLFLHVAELHGARVKAVLGAIEIAAVSPDPAADPEGADFTVELLVKGPKPGFQWARERFRRMVVHKEAMVIDSELSQQGLR
jgi:hypothetical protein